MVRAPQSTQLVEQPLCLLEVSGIEPLGEPAYDCRESVVRRMAHLVTRPPTSPLIRSVTSPSTRGRAKPPGAAR
jgi:hypothetical protein